MDLKNAKEIILKISKDFPCQIGIKLRAHHKEIFEYLNNNFKGRNISEKAYTFIHGASICKLPNCTKIPNFLSFSRGYREYCSISHAQLASETQEKIKKTNKKIYGVDHVLQAKIVREKTKATARKNYLASLTNKCKQCEKLIPDWKVFCNQECNTEFGYKIVKCSCGNEFKTSKGRPKKYCSEACIYKYVHPKLRQRFVDKYNVSSPGLLPNHINKVRATKKERYGDPNYNNKEKTIQTNLERYNVKWTGQVKEFREKKDKTTKLRYGNKNYTNRKKAIRTLQKRYKKKIHPNTEKALRKRLPYTGFGSEKHKKHLKENWDGVENISQHPDIKKKKREKKLKKYYDRLFSDPYNTIVVPLFTFEEYTGVEYYKKYPFKCLKCNTKFKDHLYSTHIPRCLNCYPILTTSNQEREILEFLQSILNCKIIHRDRMTLPENKELDFHIPSKNLAIEFDGIIWHSERFGKKNRQFHLEKTRLCELAGIQLIHIFEDEWMDKQEIVKNRLKQILGLNKSKIFARSCTIKEISFSESSEFLEKYHLRGSGNSKIKIGAFYNNKLVAVMTFGNLRISLGQMPIKNEFEIVRFASIGVVGIAGKLFKYFLNNYSPSRIITYVDRRWSTRSNVYNQLGFTFVNETNPNYWYVKNSQRFHRYTFRKSELKTKLKIFDNQLTEWENMQLNKFDRIWDCGTYKYEFKIIKNPIFLYSMNSDQI